MIQKNICWMEMSFQVTLKEDLFQLWSYKAIICLLLKKISHKFVSCKMILEMFKRVLDYNWLIDRFRCLCAEIMKKVLLYSKHVNKVGKVL